MMRHRRPRLHWGLLGLGAAVSALLSAPPAWATFENLKRFKQTYPGKPASCKVCHQNPVGRVDDLNAYGQAFRKLAAPANPKQLTEPEFRAVEPLDADGDGASNGDELQQGSDPADPASAPPPAKPSGRLPQPADRWRAPVAGWADPSAWADERAAGQAASGGAAPKAEYAGMDSCAACHVQQYREFLQSTHARISVPGQLQAQGCEMCHGPGSLHVAAGGGRGVGGIINPRKDPSVCFTCHLDKQASFRLPHHHPVLEGKMSCGDCHSPHGTDVRPWSSTTLQGVNAACFKCHKDQRGPFVWEHEAVREGCTTCHKPHGSIHEKMLVARDANVCLRCHTQADFPIMGRRDHRSFIQQGTCFSGGCHTAVHGSNFDDHLRY